MRSVGDALAPLFGAAKAGKGRIRPATRGDHVGVSGSIAPLLEKPRRLLIFGGKGGVGKTTLATATALGLARRAPDRPIVVVSIDPAHSLGDSFGQELGGELRQIRGYSNLQALELDPSQHWREFKDHWSRGSEVLFGGSNARTFEPVYDQQIAAELGKIQPTGLDELQAATSIIDLLDENSEQVVVVDSAPTGHLIRFLESPGLVIDWAKELMRLLLKYNLASRLKPLSEDLLALSRKAKRLDALLHDAETCEVIVVALPEPAVLSETRRLINRLREMKVPVRHVVINRVLGVVSRDPEGSRKLENAFPELGFLEIGQRANPVQGIAALEELAA